MTKKGASQTKAYQEAWLASNKLPHPCAYCGMEVYEFGKESFHGVVHHADENKRNNSPENLQLMHGGCHTKHHKTGVRFSDSHKAKISASLKGKPKTPEHRAAISAAKRNQRKGETHANP